MPFWGGDYNFSYSQNIGFHELYEGQCGSLSFYTCWDCHEGKNRIKSQLWG